MDVKVPACPGSFFEGRDYVSPAGSQLAEQIRDARYRDIGVQMFVLFAVFSVCGQFRGQLEVNREAVARYARVERLILKIELESEILAVVRNRPPQIIDEKLRGNARKTHSTVNYCCGHWVSSGGTRLFSFLAELIISLGGKCRQKPARKVEAVVGYWMGAKGLFVCSGLNNFQCLRRIRIPATNH